MTTLLRRVAKKPLVVVLLLLLVAHSCYGQEEEEEEEVAAASAPVTYYTSNDDMSWAVKSQRLSNAFGNKQEIYDKFLFGCNEAIDHEFGCDGAEGNRLRMNNLQVQSVRNYTQQGFAKIRTPKRLMDMIQEFYDNNRETGEDIEWPDINPYHNMWDVPTTIIRLDDVKNKGGGPVLQKAIYMAARDTMETWSGQRLSPCSAFGVRLYKNQSILAPHVDRMPLVISAIVNVDQDVDEPWPLEVYDHQGIAHNVTMQPGDMVLYESHSIIHGRPFPLNGRFYANVFIHFQPIGSLRGGSGDGEIDLESGLPPYLIPGSPWELRWRQDNPLGWDLIKDPHDAVRKGDMRTLQYFAEKDHRHLSRRDKNGWQPIHIAVQHGYIDVVEYLVQNNVNLWAKTKTGHSIFDLARLFLLRANPLHQYLEDLKIKYPEPNKNEEKDEEL